MTGEPSDVSVLLRARVFPLADQDRLDFIDSGESLLAIGLQPVVSLCSATPFRALPNQCFGTLTCTKPIRMMYGGDNGV